MSNPVGFPVSRIRADGVSARGPLLAGVVAVVLAACQTPVEEPSEPEAVAPEPAAPLRAEPEPLPEVSLGSAIDLLQRGRERPALRVLDELERQNPGNEAVANLRRQIEAPVDELIPGPYARVEVLPGESLSLIAERVLGDPLMFYALARLNGIPEPWRVAAGESIRIPAGARARELASPEVARADRDGQGDSRARTIRIVADELVRSGRIDEAWRMLLLEAEAGSANAELESALVALTERRAADLLERGRFDAAMEGLGRVLEVIDADHAAVAGLAALKQRARVGQLAESAREARAQGDYVEAYRLARRAAEIARADGSEQVEELVSELREALVEHLHNDALVAWRDRDVDLAIRLWESLVEVVPDFEPAAIYLERARQLRRRLDEP